MYTSELLTELKKESRRISNEDICLARAAVMGSVAYVPEPYRTMYSSDYFAFLYECFLELQRCSCVGVGGQIDMEACSSLLGSINEKNDPYDRKREALNRFVRVVHVYLTFIAKKPLHPVGMVFPGGAKITKDETDFYCPVKDKQSETGISFCEHCICRDSQELR